MFLVVKRTIPAINVIVKSSIFFNKEQVAILPEERCRWATAFLGHQPLDSFVIESCFSLDCSVFELFKHQRPKRHLSRMMSQQYITKVHGLMMSYHAVQCTQKLTVLICYTLVLWCQCRSVSLGCTISLCRRSSQQVHYLIMDPKRSATLPPTPSNQHSNMILWFVS